MGKSKKATPNAETPEVIPFFHELWRFYAEHRSAIRALYRPRTRKFLDYNDSSKRHDAFLRQPQFEALEMYIFLKEGLNNAHMSTVFDDWWHKRGRFEGRDAASDRVVDQQSVLFDSMPDERLAVTLRALRSGGRDYANYIFALTMGTGKTILMATCIFYEFIMARAEPDDARYCHNALVIAPDTTVLQSLREITTFDRCLVVPPSEQTALESEITFHYMADADTLNVLRGSRFNLVIANAQKIILKRSKTTKGTAQQLFKAERNTFAPKTAFDRLQKLLAQDEPETEVQIVASQRFRKLLELDKLGIYVDEAHHAFGQPLARDVGAESDTRTTSLRLTISELAAKRREGGSPVVACYNFTGTPYYKKGVFPEVVYSYGLKSAVEKRYLKRTRFYGYEHVKSDEFVRQVIGDFLGEYKGKRFEGMLPKLAFFAATIDELENELRPAVEEALVAHGVSLNTILVNTEKSTNDEIREFIRLDTPESEKQFMLLVNKGKEGWNCRSLFAVALFRQPKSRVFVLQASMRCLRSIDPPQQTGHIYLSIENMKILQEELEQNFRTSTEELGSIGTKRRTYTVQPVPPPREIIIKRTRKLCNLMELHPEGSVDLALSTIDLDSYGPTRKVSEGLPTVTRKWGTLRDEKLAYTIKQAVYTAISLCAELARHLNRSPIEIEDLLTSSTDGMDAVLEMVNTSNNVIYEELIPRLFKELYIIEEFEKHEDELITLVEPPKDGEGFQVSGEPEKVVDLAEIAETLRAHTFHIAPYVFDSYPERDFFQAILRLMERGLYSDIYFTGMLTHGQSRFFVPYVDPETEALRSYYPDFLVCRNDGVWIIVEIKADNMIDDVVVQAKAESAHRLAENNRFLYRMIPAKQVTAGHSERWLERVPVDGLYA
jgi:hypothetical protein